MKSVYDIIDGDLVQGLAAIEEILDHHDEIHQQSLESSVNFDVDLLKPVEDGRISLNSYVKQLKLTKHTSLLHEKS